MSTDTDVGIDVDIDINVESGADNNAGNTCDGGDCNHAGATNRNNNKLCCGLHKETNTIHDIPHLVVKTINDVIHLFVAG